jgi:hypothetical protein
LAWLIMLVSNAPRVILVRGIYSNSMLMILRESESLCLQFGYV